MKQKRDDIKPEQYSGILYYMPSPWRSYAELMRLEKPIGWWLLLLPCWFSTLLGGLYSQQTFLSIIDELVLFALGAIIMRGAGCVINDLADRKFDGQVERTKNRPLPSGRVKPYQALIFFIILLCIGLLILLQFDRQTQIITTASLILVIAYPFAKRVTHWPQLILGLVFNWGVFAGWSAIVGADWYIALILYLGCIAWTIGYDTIYAHQDKEDDIQIGVRSTALLFGENTKKYICIFYALFSFCIAASFYFALWHDLTQSYFRLIGVILTYILFVAHLSWQIRHIDISNSTQCLVLFKSNKQLGLILCLGLCLLYIM